MWKYWVMTLAILTAAYCSYRIYDTKNWQKLLADKHKKYGVEPRNIRVSMKYDLQIRNLCLATFALMLFIPTAQQPEVPQMFKGNIDDYRSTGSMAKEASELDTASLLQFENTSAELPKMWTSISTDTTTIIKLQIAVHTEKDVTEEAVLKLIQTNDLMAVENMTVSSVATVIVNLQPNTNVQFELCEADNRYYVYQSEALVYELKKKTK